MSKKKVDSMEIRHSILFYLHRNNYWKNRHTPKTNLCNKLSHFPCKKINKELNRLYKDEFIRIKKTFHGDDVFLNIKMKKEIENEIQYKLDALYDF